MRDASSGSPPLSWLKSDPEQRCGFRGGRFTRVNGVFTLILGLVASLLFYLLLIPIYETYFAQSFIHRGPIPYIIIGFFFWSAAILLDKTLKLRLQKRSLEVVVVPTDPGFVLSPASVGEVLAKIHHAVDDPKKFVLFNRIVIALSNLRNLGRVTDVDDILRSQGENDEASMETSYHLLQGLVWGMPVLGFIGTVLGLSQAIGGFGSVLATSAELSQLKLALQEVTAGLAIAFETTLHGLVAAMIIQLWLTGLKIAEEEFLDGCGEYCLRHVVGRLRLLPYESQED